MEYFQAIKITIPKDDARGKTLSDGTRIIAIVASFCVINVISSAIIVLGRMTFINNSEDEQIGDFAISRCGTLAMYFGAFFILLSYEKVREYKVCF